MDFLRKSLTAGLAFVLLMTSAGASPAPQPVVSAEALAKIRSAVAHESVEQLEHVLHSLTPQARQAVANELKGDLRALDAELDRVTNSIVSGDEQKRDILRFVKKISLIVGGLGAVSSWLLSGQGYKMNKLALKELGQAPMGKLAFKRHFYGSLFRKPDPSSIISGMPHSAGAKSARRLRFVTTLGLAGLLLAAGSAATLAFYPGFRELREKEISQEELVDRIQKLRSAIQFILDYT